MQSHSGSHLPLHGSTPTPVLRHGRVPCTSTLTQVPQITCVLTNPVCTPSPQGRHSPLPTHTKIPSHLCLSQGHSQSNPGTWTWSCTPSIPCLVLPSPSFPPFQGWSQSGTKAQCPLLPSPSPLPSGVQRLCPPTAEPERQSEQSGRDIGPRLPEVQGRTGVVRARAAAVGHLGEGVAR